MTSLRKLVASVFWKLALILSSESRKVKPDWVVVNSGPLQGRQLYLDKNHGWSRDFADGTYDDYIYRLLAQLGLPKHGAVVWDIGAFIGYYSMAFASQVGPSGRVVSFEPNPTAVRYFSSNLERNPELAETIQIVNAAISNSDGKQMFRCSEEFLEAPLGFLDASGPPSERISPKTYRGFRSIPIDVYRIDTLIQQGYPPPSLIKIDVEGAELLVLEGAREYLAAHHPVLLMEVHNIKAMFAVQEFLLVQLGYQTEFIEHSTAQSSSRAFIIAQSRSVEGK